jgi:CRP/FNR family transcriptional regulator, polysaccharide utilization system transcription regulator
LNQKDLHPNCQNCLHSHDSVFCDLNPKELEELYKDKSSKFIRKGQVVFYENDPVKGLHCIESGKIKLYKTLDDGGVQILKISKDSELIGYRGLLGNGKYIATAEAIEDTQICFIPRQSILNLLSHNPQFSLQLLSKFASDLSEAEDKSIRFIQKTSKERLAEALLMLEKSFGTDEHGFILINLTRQEIGAYAGLATETIIRAIKLWEEEGILQLNKKQIKILNHARLIEISNVFH